ncbi:MAG TPA: lysozyme inhibitor LprI family protein [Gallionellaceae bacterium]
MFLLLLPILACAAPAVAATAEAFRPGPHIEVQADLKASFSCTEAQTIDEQLICSERELAELDRRMSEIYSTARAGLSQAEKKALLQTQRTWLGGHDQACGISAQEFLPSNASECIANRYHARIAELLAIISRGNVIRELGGAEPWAENVERYGMSKNHVDMLQSCVGEELEDEVNACCAPGTETVEETESSTTAYAINGKRYLLYNGKYQQFFNVPRGACTTEIDEKGEESMECPEVAPTFGSCAALYAETEPGKGDFAYTGHRWNSPVTLAGLLSGGSRERLSSEKFVSDLHAKLLPGDAITLAPKKGEPSQYRWDAGKKAYVQQ